MSRAIGRWVVHAYRVDSTTLLRDQRYFLGPAWDGRYLSLGLWWWVCWIRRR